MSHDTRTEVGRDHEAARPRIFMASMRDVGTLAAWGAMSEFEDVICEVDEVHRVDIQCARSRSWKRRAVQRLVWRQISPLFTRLNPGLRPIAPDADYDLFVFVCMNPWELLALNAVRGWKENCRKKILFMFEVWSDVVPNYRHLFGKLDDFDQVFIGFKNAVPAVQEITSTPCHFLPPASDALRFSPYPDPPERCIDVFSLGRRSESMHEQLLEMAERREIFYIHDTIPGRCVQPVNFRQHRGLFASIAQRSRFFITYPAKVDTFSETHGLVEPGTRFYEGLATGAVMVGQAPEGEVFDRDFNWPDSVITIGDRIENLEAVMARFERDPGDFDRLSRRNVSEALRRHDWAHRWKEMLEIAGVPPREALAERESRLNQIAGTI